MCTHHLSIPQSHTLQMTQRMSYSQMLTGETPSPLSLIGRRGEKEVTVVPRSLWAFETMTFFVIVLNALKPLYFYCRNSGGCNYLNTSNIKNNNLMNEIMWSLRFIGVKPVIPGMHFWFRQGRHLIKIKAIIHWCPLKRQDLS